MWVLVSDAVLICLCTNGVARYALDKVKDFNMV